MSVPSASEILTHAGDTPLQRFLDAHGLTQTELAQALGVSQAAVAKTEQREDLLLSTLNAYIEALGGQAHIVITFNGEEIDLDLGALRRNATPA